MYNMNLQVTQCWKTCVMLFSSVQVGELVLYYSMYLILCNSLPGCILHLHSLRRITTILQGSRGRLTVAMPVMLSGVKGGDRLGRPPRSGKFITTNLHTSRCSGFEHSWQQYNNLYCNSASLQHNLSHTKCRSHTLVQSHACSSE